MAHIFKAHNPNKEKVKLFVLNHVFQEEQKFKDSLYRRPRQRVIAISVIAVCVILILILLFKKGLLGNITQSISQPVRDWCDRLFSAKVDHHLLFDWLLKFAGRILAFLVYLLTYLFPVLIPVVLFGGLGLIAFIAFCGYQSTFSEFDRQAATERAESLMDGDMCAIKAGVDGEEATLNVVSALDDDCYVFVNLTPESENEANEADIIVLSPTGLTVVEVKNYSGLLMGDLSDPQLIGRKYHKYGDYTDSPKRNPVKQTGTQVYRLAHYLKDHGIRVTVRRCAVFVNDNVEFQLTDRQGLVNSCPLFMKNSPEFLTYLHQPGSRALSSKEIDRIVKALKELL